MVRGSDIKQPVFDVTTFEWLKYKANVQVTALMQREAAQKHCV